MTGFNLQLNFCIYFCLKMTRKEIEQRFDSSQLSVSNYGRRAQTENICKTIFINKG